MNGIAEETDDGEGEKELDEEIEIADRFLSSNDDDMNEDEGR